MVRIGPARSSSRVRIQPRPPPPLPAAPPGVVKWPPMQSEDAGGRPRPAGRSGVLVGLLLAAVAAAFGRVVGHEFSSWDDLVNVVANPHVDPPSLEGTLFFWRHAYMDMYIPVTYTLWALLARIALEPWLFHAASLLVHAAAALAAFGLLRRLVRDDRAACAGALLFALHPVQAESVGWMSGMKDLLAGLFGLLALARYVDFAAGRREGATRAGAYLAALLFYLVALLSKPSAVAVPILAAILDLGVVRRTAREVARALAPFLAIALGWILLTRHVQPAAGVFVPPLEQRPLVALDALAFYFRKLCLPLSLAPDPGRDPAWVLEQGRPWLSALVLLAVVALLLALVRWGKTGAARTAAVGTGLFVAGVAPVLGLVPFDFQRYSTVADHYLYLPMIGPALGLAWVLSRRAGHAAFLAAGGLLAILGLVSAVQVGVWKDDLTLYRHTIAVNPRSWVAHDNLGSALATRGRTLEALPEYEAALAINPRDVRTHCNFGTALDELDRTQEAIPHFEAAVALEPRDRPARENFAIALLRLGRPAEAETQLRAALDIDPGSFRAHYYLAGAVSWLGRLEEAIPHLEEAVRLEPRYAPARRDLAAARKALGRKD